MNAIAASSIAQTQALTQAQLGVSMLKKTLDMTAEQGAELVKMMDQSAGIGGRVDLNA